MERRKILLVYYICSKLQKELSFQRKGEMWYDGSNRMAGVVDSFHSY